MSIEWLTSWSVTSLTIRYGAVTGVGKLATRKSPTTVWIQIPCRVVDEADILIVNTYIMTPTLVQKLDSNVVSKYMIREK